MRRFVFIIKLLLVILMLAFIWGQSMLPGDISENESSRILELVRPAVLILQRGFARSGFDFDEMFLVRKLAHFTEYAVLGALMFLLFLRPDGDARYILPMGLCLVSAGIDEGIQIFAVNRGPALKDLILDFTGSCAGILATGLIVVIVYYRLRRKGRYGYR